MVGPDVYLQKEVETVMPVLKKLPGVGSLYCFVTETNEKVTLEETLIGICDEERRG